METPGAQRWFPAQEAGGGGGSFSSYFGTALSLALRSDGERMAGFDPLTGSERAHSGRVSCEGSGAGSRVQTAFALLARIQTRLRLSAEQHVTQSFRQLTVERFVRRFPHSNLRISCRNFTLAKAP